jgi:uncharacterized protein YggU (UPF0235/DUF167 family)
MVDGYVTYADPAQIGGRIMIRVQGHGRGAVLPIRVHAGGSHNRVVGSHDGMLRISVTAAPEKGKSNKAVANLLSQVFCVPKSSVQLIAGATSPRKRFLFLNVEPDELQDRCIRLIESN